MEQPEGFVMHGQENKVCKLDKSLYGTKNQKRARKETEHTNESAATTFIKPRTMIVSQERLRHSTLHRASKFDAFLQYVEWIVLH